MELNDITNIPIPLRSSRTTSVHLCLPKEFAPSIQNVQDEESKSGRRAAGHTNVDLWVEGRLYPKDPAVQYPPTFFNLNTFLQYVGRGEQGVLGYCKRLSLNATDGLESIMRQYQILYSNHYHLQQRILESEKEKESLKNAIKEKDEKLSKLKNTSTLLKETPLGARERK